MTYKITSLEDWGGDSKGSLTEHVYYTDMVDVEEAIERFNQNLKKKQATRPQITEWITEIKRMDRIEILS